MMRMWVVRSSRRGHLRAVLATRCVFGRPRFTHIWGQLCGQSPREPWTDRRRSVDNSCSTRGQIGPDRLHPPTRRSTHGPVRRRVHMTPHRATCADDLRPHHPQALVLLLEISSSGKEERRSGGENAFGPPTVRVDTPTETLAVAVPAEVTPEPGSLYGGAPVPARVVHHDDRLEPQTCRGHDVRRRPEQIPPAREGSPP